MLNHARLFENLSAASLVEEAVRRKEGQLTSMGAFAAITGEPSGRSPKDKFIVRQPSNTDSFDWTNNQPMEPATFNRLRDLVLAYLQNRDLFTFDGYACADPKHQISVRVVAEKAWHALFARCLFRRPTPKQLPGFHPEWTVLHACDFWCDPARDGTKSKVCVATSFEQKLIIVTGTHYAGEIKKSIFGILNGLLPSAGVFPMHCSANIGSGGDTALYFGLSGTGKTTLSADPTRRLIGDDEHGWSDEGIFNIEGGCYAKTIKLSPTGEPQIWNALRFGCVLENVPVDAITREPDFNSTKLTENTRGAYPVDFIPNCELSGRGGHPANIFFLTYDAFGVLPPLSRLTPEQAMDQFLLGYTAKVAGTEAGITEPTPEFSTCFAKPFLPLPPQRYAELLKAKLARFSVPVWLVNTGMIGGANGSRMKLAHTRALLAAALNGSLQDITFVTDPIFGVSIPTSCPDVPSEVLLPKNAWADAAAYDATANKLAGLFRENLKKYRV
jgi:phosphoenolpyruvate carboxykinase (ATP)